MRRGDVGVGLNPECPVSMAWSSARGPGSCAQAVLGLRRPPYLEHPSMPPGAVGFNLELLTGPSSLQVAPVCTPSEGTWGPVLP